MNQTIKRDFGKRDFGTYLSDGLTALFYGLLFGFVYFFIVTKALSTYRSVFFENTYVPMTVWILAFTLFSFCFLSGAAARKTQAGALSLYVFWPLFLFSLALGLRLLVVLFFGMDTTQLYDFARAYDNTLLPAPLGNFYYRLFPSWCFYSRCLKEVNLFFGFSPLTGIVLNAVLSALNTALIYYIALLFSAHRRRGQGIGVFSALLYLFWPMNNFSIILLCPDYFFGTAFLSGLLFYLGGQKALQKGRIFLALLSLALCGAAMGTASFFKPIDKIFYIALFIIMVLQLLARTPKISKSYLQFARRQVVSFLLLLLISGFTVNTLYDFLDRYVGAPVDRNVSSYFLYVGLHQDSRGMWAQDITDLYCNTVKDCDFDYDRVDAIFKEKLTEELADPKHPSSKFLNRKLKVAWSTDVAPNFINETIAPSAFFDLPAFWERTAPLSDGYYIMVMALVALGAVLLAIRRERGIFMLMGLLVFGFSLLLLLSEVQDRYKLVVYPFLSLLGGYGGYMSLEAMGTMLTCAFRILLPKHATLNQTEAHHD